MTEPAIIRTDFPTSQYVQEKTRKTQIVLHHTVSGPGVSGDIGWWKSTSERVATHFVIDREGLIYQLFDLEHWAWHLGLTNAHFQKAHVPYRKLDPTSVGIEIDSWGFMEKRADGTFTPWGMAGKARPVPADKVHEYCAANLWRGKQYYEKYTPAQISALAKLLPWLCCELGIPKQYNVDMWGLSANALSGKPGIWTHASYRPDKSDCHPQPELCKMLQNL